MEWYYVWWPWLTCKPSAELLVMPVLSFINMTHDIDLAFLSLRLTICHVVVLCLNEYRYHHFFAPPCRDSSSEVVGDRTMNVLSLYTSHSGESDEEKENIWCAVFQIVSNVSLDEVVVFADDTNCQVGRINTGFTNVRGGFGYGNRILIGDEC